VKLIVSGTFNVPDGTSFFEAVVRFAIRLKQMAADKRTTAPDWTGTIAIDLEKD
jgi:hypothetical protein